MNLAESDPVKSAIQYLETEKSFGLSHIAVEQRIAAMPLRSSDKNKELQILSQKYANCTACPLSTTRKNVVFGSGSATAELMFVGEAPGQDEDIQGLPFVGAAGQLLTKIIEAMKLSREQVYIANCLKCRPPQNRNPLPDEIASCSPILLKQIEIIQPKIICTLGKFASQALLNTEEPISRLRGKFFDYRGIPLIPTFHPAYLLRNPADKKYVWQDMQLVMKRLGISL